MNPATHSLVRQRAEDRCEYGSLSQDDLPFARFHVEHIKPKQHGGADDPSNLALACRHCNLKKGPNLTAIDPESGQVILLFHPRLDIWYEHFERVGAMIAGKSPKGRATVRLLSMNTIERINFRADRDS